MSDIKPFDPTIPQEEVERLFRKLKDTRLPEIPVVPDAGDDYGEFGCVQKSMSWTKYFQARRSSGSTS